MLRDLVVLTAAGNNWLDVVNYEIIRGNALWRFALVLVGILMTMAAGHITLFIINKYVTGREQKLGATVITLFLKALAKPIYVGVFAFGLNFCKVFLYFDADKGIKPIILDG